MPVVRQLQQCIILRIADGDGPESQSVRFRLEERIRQNIGLAEPAVMNLLNQRVGQHPLGDAL